jgi:hypothetical protein
MFHPLNVITFSKLHLIKLTRQNNFYIHIHLILTQNKTATNYQHSAIQQNSSCRHICEYTGLTVATLLISRKKYADILNFPL